MNVMKINVTSWQIRDSKTTSKSLYQKNTLRACSAPTQARTTIHGGKDDSLFNFISSAGTIRKRFRVLYNICFTITILLSPSLS